MSWKTYVFYVSFIVMLIINMIIMREKIIQRDNSIDYAAEIITYQMFDISKKEIQIKELTEKIDMYEKELGRVEVFIKTLHPRLSREKTQKLAKIFIRAGKETDIDPALLATVGFVESTFNSKSISPTGAKGIMQINDLTQQEMGIENPFDTEESIFGGARYLKKMVTRFGNLKSALAAYNAGPSGIRKKIPKPTKKYIKKILELYTINGEINKKSS